MLFKLNKDIHDYNDLSTFRMFKVCLEPHLEPHLVPYVVPF